VVLEEEVSVLPEQELAHGLLSTGTAELLEVAVLVVEHDGIDELVRNVVEI